jgi:hypothetical protein
MWKNKKELWILNTFLILFLIFSCHKKIDNKEKESVNKDTLNKNKVLINDYKELKTENNDSICENCIFKILESSDRFKEITTGLEQRVKNNGGLGFTVWLEASPYQNDSKNSKSDRYSEHFELSIHENYDDRTPRIASFEFAPEKGGLLYEIDVANDSLIVIDFNKELLLEYNHFCK